MYCHLPKETLKVSPFLKFNIKIKWIMNKWWLYWPSWAEINLVYSLFCVVWKLWMVFTFLKCWKERRKGWRKKEKRQRKKKIATEVACGLPKIYATSLFIENVCNLWSIYHNYRKNSFLSLSLIKVLNIYFHQWLFSLLFSNTLHAINCIYLKYMILWVFKGNYHPNQDTKYFYHLQKLLLASLKFIAPSTPFPMHSFLLS